MENFKTIVHDYVIPICQILLLFTATYVVYMIPSMISSASDKISRVLETQLTSFRSDIKGKLD